MRLPFRRILALLAGSVLLVALPAAASQGGVVIAGTIGTPETDLTPEQEQHLLGEYWAIARAYLTGDAAKSIRDMSAWTRDRVGKVQSIQFQPERGFVIGVDTKAEWSTRFLRGAAMLHIDIALNAFRARDTQQFEFQAAIADGWLTLADNRKSAPGSLRSRLNVALARLLIASGDLGLAERHLVRLNERIPNDPAIQLAYGTVKEAQAMRRLAASPGGALEDPARAAPARRTDLTAAAALFQKAVTDATQIEARLRLAHVHILKGDDAEAEALLKDVLATPAPSLKYLALLMRGGILERRGELEPAARAYLDAILAAPGGQSGYMALAHVMQRMNQRDAAAAVLDCMFEQGVATAGADPWWAYPLGLALKPESAFDELRAEIRK